MEVVFDKYQGAGNDFIIMDNRHERYSNLNTFQLKSLCDIFTGIVANGIIFIQHTPDADFEMHYFNSDVEEDKDWILFGEQLDDAQKIGIDAISVDVLSLIHI